MAICNRCGADAVAHVAGAPQDFRKCQDRHDCIRNYTAWLHDMCVGCHSDFESDMVLCTRLDCDHGPACLTAKILKLGMSRCCPRGLLMHTSIACSPCQEVVAVLEEAVKAARNGPITQVHMGLLEAVQRQLRHLIPQASAVTWEGWVSQAEVARLKRFQTWMIEAHAWVTHQVALLQDV